MVYFILNRKIFFILFILLIIFSLSTIHAGDVSNITDRDIVQLDDSELNTSLKESNISNVQLTPQTNSVYYKGSYNVTLKDSYINTTLSDKNVNFVIEDSDFSSKTDDYGVASVNLNLNPGNYSLFAYFEGDDNYGANNITASIEILPTIKAGDMTKYYGGSTKYTATFFDSQGNFQSNQLVNISVDGKVYSKKTNSKGVVSLAMNLKPGPYKITSTDPLTGYTLTTTFKILPTITANNFKKVKGDSKKFTAKFYKSNGKVLAKKNVKFKVNGKTYKVKTNSKGKASLSLNNLKKGSYKIISYNRDGSTKTNTVKIYGIASTKLTTYFYTLLPNDTREIKIKFKTDLDDDSNVGKTIKIKINGKTYSRLTDSNGKIYFKLPSLSNGLYKVEYSYSGNKFFKSAKSTNYVTLIGTSQSKLSVKGTTNFGYGANTPIKVALTAGGVPLLKRTVSLTIGDKTYFDTTDEKGIVTMPIDLKIGNYTVKYSSQDESKINGTSGSFDITVFKRNPCKIIWKSGNSYKDSSQTFKVLVTNLNGKSLSEGDIELTIDGETYYGKLSSKGYATIKTSVAIGKYKVKVKFLGINDYLPNSTSHSINVKLSKFGSGLNEKNSISSLGAYLKSSSHCKVGNAKIKALVKSLTGGLTDNVDKAKAIFNYVRDTLAYSLYYNTKHGAVGTFNLKSGNCVDHSHLLVSMYRTAGFKARYVHGVCHFNSGHTYGHVWAQVLIGKHWVCADATSYGNVLGKISNWNTNSYKIHAKYRSLPF